MDIAQYTPLIQREYTDDNPEWNKLNVSDFAGIDYCKSKFVW